MTNRSTNIRLLTACSTLILLLSACDEKALDFASKMSILLDQRSKLLSQKIAAEEKAYKDLARLYADAGEKQLFQALANEMIERSQSLAAEYASGARPPYWWNRDVNEYRKLAFDAQVQLLTEESDQVAKQLSALETLKMEKDQIEALKAALESLAKKRKLSEELAFLKAFGNDASKAYEKLLCDSAKASLDKASTPEEKAKWTSFIKDKGCPAS